MGASELAAVLRTRVGFVIGKHDDVAPAHLSNAFLGNVLGIPEDWQHIRDFVTGVDVEPSDFPAIQRSGFQRGSSELRDLQADVDVAVNPDRRGWQSVAASFAPVHARFITRDPSDDGNGGYLWAAISEFLSTAAVEDLQRLLNPTGDLDPVSTMCAVISKGAVKPSERPPQRVQPSGWFSPKPRKSVYFVRNEIASVISSLADTSSAKGRVEAIQHLVRGTYFAWYLGLLFGPLAASTTRRVGQMNDLHEFLVYADVPPGTPDDPVVVGSSRSLQQISQELSEVFRVELEGALESVTVPDRLPGSKMEFRLRVLLGEAGYKGDALDRAISGFPRASTGSTVASYARQIATQTHSADAIAHTLRTLGRMIGLAGPARGFGVPRFLLETPLLSTLVRIAVTETSIPFSLFVDRLRTRFGMVVGIGSDEDVPSRLALWDSTDATRDFLLRNEDALRTRLISAGLAYQYSDLNTEVFSDG